MPMAPATNLSHFDHEGTIPTARSGAQSGTVYTIISPVPRATIQSTSVDEGPARERSPTTHIATARETARQTVMQTHRKMRSFNEVVSGKARLVVVGSANKTCQRGVVRSAGTTGQSPADCSKADNCSRQLLADGLNR